MTTTRVDGADVDAIGLKSGNVFVTMTIAIGAESFDSGGGMIGTEKSFVGRYALNDETIVSGLGSAIASAGVSFAVWSVGNQPPKASGVSSQWSLPLNTQNDRRSTG